MNAERRAEIVRILNAKCHELLEREIELTIEHEMEIAQTGRYDAESPILHRILTATAVRSACISVLATMKLGKRTPIDTIRRHVDKHRSRMGVNGNYDAITEIGRLERLFAESSPEAKDSV